METTTINQIIETMGIIVSPILTIWIAYFFSKKLLKFKDNITREISLSKDIIYFQTIIQLYKEKTLETEKTNQYNTFRKKAKEILEYEQSYFSKPSVIKKRLEYLDELNEKVKKNIDKITKNI